MLLLSFFLLLSSQFRSDAQCFSELNSCSKIRSRSHSRSQFISRALPGDYKKKAQISDSKVIQDQQSDTKSKSIHSIHAVVSSPYVPFARDQFMSCPMHPILSTHGIEVEISSMPSGIIIPAFQISNISNSPGHLLSTPYATPPALHRSMALSISLPSFNVLSAPTTTSNFFIVDCLPTNSNSGTRSYSSAYPLAVASRLLCSELV